MGDESRSNDLASPVLNPVVCHHPLSRRHRRPRQQPLTHTRNWLALAASQGRGDTSSPPRGSSTPGPGTHPSAGLVYDGCRRGRRGSRHRPRRGQPLCPLPSAAKLPSSHLSLTSHIANISPIWRCGNKRETSIFFESDVHVTGVRPSSRERDYVGMLLSTCTIKIG
jgi:hypothetical protein